MVVLPVVALDERKLAEVHYSSNQPDKDGKLGYLTSHRRNTSIDLLAEYTGEVSFSMEN